MDAGADAAIDGRGDVFPPGTRGDAMPGNPGADEAFHIAYHAHRDPLLRWARVLTRDDAAAEEIAQEAFLRLLCEMRAGRAPDNVGGWLHRVAANLVASRARRARVAERRREQLRDAWRVESVEASVLGRELVTELRQAFDVLPPDQRSILLMAARGLPGHEIAATLGVSRVASRTRLHRARAHLRLELTTA